MSSPRPIPAMLLFFSLVWLLPALACGSSEGSTPTPTFSQAAATNEASQVEQVAPTPTIIDPDRDVFVYAMSMSIITDSFTEAMDSLEELFLNPQILNKDWQMRVATNLVLIRQAYENVSALSPPVPLRTAHDIAVKGFSKCNDATYLMVDGLDNREEKKHMALELIDKIIPVFHELGRKDWEAKALIRKGNILTVLQEFDAAEDTYERVIEISSDADKSPWAKDMIEMVAYGKGNLGVVANSIGKHDRAIELLNDCNPYITQVMDRAVVLMELAIANYHKKQFLESIELADRSQSLVVDLHLGRSISESDPNWEIEVLPGLKRKRLIFQLWDILSFKRYRKE